jgi:hypothetical protein
MFDEKFLEDNLPKILGLSNIPSDKKQLVIKEMQKHIQTTIATKVMEKLKMKEKMKLGVLMMKKNPEEISKFMLEKIPGFPQMIQEEMQNFRPKAMEIINS